MIKIAFREFYYEISRVRTQIRIQNQSTQTNQFNKIGTFTSIR